MSSIYGPGALQAANPASAPGQLAGAKGASFRSIFGAIAGTAANLALPGAGGVIGRLISGRGAANSGGLTSVIAGAPNAGGVGGASDLLGQVGGLNSGDQTIQYLQLQMAMNQEARAFEAASAVLKARHDAAMSAIRNIH
jgi:hypothetical protein